jgi:hypothetical protein
LGLVFGYVFLYSLVGSARFAEDLNFGNFFFTKHSILDYENLFYLFFLNVLFLNGYLFMIYLLNMPAG